MKKLAYIVCFLAVLYFSIHILIYLRTIPVQTTAFWVIIRFIIAYLIGLVSGVIVISLCVGGKMDDARRAIYAALDGDLSLCRKFFQEGR